MSEEEEIAFADEDSGDDDGDGPPPLLHRGNALYDDDEDDSSNGEDSDADADSDDEDSDHNQDEDRDNEDSTIRTNTTCANCRRKGADLTVHRFSRQLLIGKHNKPYYALPKLTRQEISLRNREGRDGVSVYLCSCCVHYLLENSNDAGDYWPAMIYKFLALKNSKHVLKVPFYKKWSLIPHTWRHWWQEEFRHRIIPNEPVFVDVTKELCEVKEAIDELKWVRLAKCMDEHFAYPEVRCPWGCSEFLHRCGRLQLKDFLWYFSNYEMKCYRTPTSKHWTDSISPSYPTPCLILEKFVCSPSIAMTDDEGPVILCCREHSATSTNAYLHVPESPTGAIYTPNCNSFAPVAIRSRTNRNFKPNLYSDTFCTMKQVGGFGGIDSSYITSTNMPNRCDSLSNMRDSLSIQGRPDIRAQIYDRCTEPRSASFISQEKVEKILSISERHFPEPSFLPEYKTATYIPCETAVRLQEFMYGESASTIKVYTEDMESDEYHHRVFVPPWPTMFVQVHSMNGHGERFLRVTNLDFGLWMLLCITGRVTDLWEAIADDVHDNRSWHGHWLNFATQTLNFRGKKTKSKYFPIAENVHDLFPDSLQTILADSISSASLFGSCHKVHVVDGLHLELEDENLRGKTVIICINPQHRHDGNGNVHDEFELRCLLSAKDDDNGNLVPRNEWRMYVRHRGQQFWVQHGTNHPCKYNGNTLRRKAWKGARIAVYCRKQSTDCAGLQRRYLNAIGGQNYAYCSVHRCPLVLNHGHKRKNGTSRPCICEKEDFTGSDESQLCLAFGSYVCPHGGCNVAICDKHLATTKKQCIECSPETIVYVSVGETELCSCQCNGDGICSGAVDPEMADIPPEALGPTDAHELPQDRVDFDDENNANTLIADDDNSEDSWNDEENLSIASSQPTDDELSSVDTTSIPGMMEDESLVNLDDNRSDASIEGDDSDMTDNIQTAGQVPALDHFDTTGIPTTATGVEQREISVEHYDADGIKIPLCVLLNQQGHLLTRTNHKIRMNKLHRSICERLVSKNVSKVIPLVYAEAQLFPTIFWCSMDDGTVPGAVPTALWADKSTLGKFGFGSMREHAKMRISNPALLTSVDTAYHFLLLDQLANLGTCGKHTRIVLQRGFAEHQHRDGISFRDNDGTNNSEIYGETSENHANVHKLSALVHERRPHFFFTQTCNQKTCRGLKILREWITSTEALMHLHKKYGLDFSEATRYLRESAASYVSRSWNEVVDMWMRYIIYSSEEPLGPIDYAWYRKEFQDTEGNLAHIHAILRTLYNIDNPQELEIVLHKIRGCLTDLIHYEEYVRMHEEGIISSIDHLIDILEQAKAYLTHRCHTRCQIPVTTRDGETFFVCKVHENYYRTLTPHIHSIQPVNVSHLPEAKKIYNDIGMMQGNEILDPCLVSEYHVPISSLEDSKFSPTNGGLFARFPSSQNIQYTTGRALADYLVKYVTTLDKVARAEMKPPRHYDPTRARATVEQLHNTKITSNKIIADKTQKKSSNYGRIVTHTECLSVILAEEIVKSTVQFIYFSTSPREYRQAFYKQGRCKTPMNVPDAITYLTNVSQDIRRRRRFPESRLFSVDQMLVIFDERSSAVSVDAITVFSIRPPELRFVNIVSLYFRWFERQPMKYTNETIKDELERRIDKDITKCHWIDGLHMHIVLRRGAIPEILDYAMDCDWRLFGSNSQQKSTMVNHLRQIQRLENLFGQDSSNMVMDEDTQMLNTIATRHTTTQSSRGQYERICDSFLSKDCSIALPVPWTTPIFPKNRGRFLVYILLLFGRFETEYGLMNQQNMRAAYIHAGLFDPGEPENSVRLLLERYAKECIRKQCGSVQQKDRNLILASAAFAECLLEVNDELVIGTPCVLQSAMRDETTEKIREYKHKMLSSFIGALYADLQSSGFSTTNLPNRANIEAMHFKNTPLRDDGMDWQTVGEVEYTFPPNYDPNGLQSLDSYTEQKTVLENAKISIDRYMRGFSHKNIVICGGPGNGKTTVCEEICLYAFSKGLRGTATSIVADRSKALGGTHIHLLCAIPLGHRCNQSPGRTAESALSCIYRKPELLHFWRELQFLYIDEFGAVSAEMFATMDIIARKIKDSSQFLGGILVICSMDIHQLLPINGTALMLSMNMMCEFNFMELTESVRAARDANLRRLCNLTRDSEWNDEKRDEFRHIIMTYCNFVETFDDPSLPEDGIYVFGRRAPCQKIEELLIAQMEDDGNIQLVVSTAEDEESSVAGNWKTASVPVTQGLSRRLKRKSRLVLFEKGRYEFTYNLHGKFQQGQLAILLSIDQDDVDNHRQIEFFKGPPGCKEFPSLQNFTEEFLESNGWEKVLVPFETSKPQHLWGRIIGRRLQYGVRLRIASTIHASQGATLGKLITAISHVDDFGDLNFNLWDAAQVVVLLSRTRSCHDIYFVGKKEEIVDHLLAVLEMRSKYMAHITSMTQRLCHCDNDTPILLNSAPIFRPCDVVLDRIPAVYLLVSTRSYGYMYIGETKDIRRRLRDHNSGRGSLFTNNERLRPWALFGYVAGFQTKSDNRRNFEQYWKRRVIMRRKAWHVGTPMTVLGVARDIVAEKNRSRRKHHHLRVVQCGAYELRQHDTTYFRLVN